MRVLEIAIEQQVYVIAGIITALPMGLGESEHKEIAGIILFSDFNYSFRKRGQLNFHC